MTQHEAEELKQSIVFAFYKGNKLKGFRMDTVGNIGLYPKVYTYSKQQVSIVLKNVFDNIEEVHKTAEERIEELAEEVGTGNPILATVRDIFRSSANKLRDFGEFEVRVLPCPPKKSVFENDEEAMIEWIQNPLPEPIEIHKFKV